MTPNVLDNHPIVFDKKLNGIWAIGDAKEKAQHGDSASGFRGTYEYYFKEPQTALPALASIFVDVNVKLDD